MQVVYIEKWSAWYVTIDRGNRTDYYGPHYKESDARLAARRMCQCGSGENKHEERDARGIFLCYACSQCRNEKLARYRPDVLTDSNYWTDEPIESD